MTTYEILLLLDPEQAEARQDDIVARVRQLARTFALRIGAPDLALPPALVETPKELQLQTAQMVATPLLSTSDPVRTEFAWP